MSEEKVSGERHEAITPVSAEETPAEETPGEGVAVHANALEELQDRYLRLAAEFDNYRKRVARERADLIRTAHEGVLLDLFPVLDNLERALVAARSSAASSGAIEAVIEGVENTLRLFKGVLEKQGVKEIESVGREFDPTVHHAVEQVRTDDYAENTVVEEILRGYLLDHKVLRPALVKVSASGAPSGEAAGRSGVTDGE